MSKEDELFRQAMEELARTGREAMWKAKVGNPDRSGPSREAAAALQPAAEEPPPAPAAPLRQPALLADFERLLADGGPAPTGRAQADPDDDEDRPGSFLHVGAMQNRRAVRLGESPLDASDLPGLARPRAQEMRDLEHGRRDVDRRIDLHGKTVVESRRLLRDELAHAREAGLHYLLIITGRGLRSESGARLRPAVQQFLAGDGREHVLWFDEAPRRFGGGGAFLVRVRRPGRLGQGEV